MERIGSGSDVIDELLEGGFEKDILTTIYGPAGSGKTCSCILACVEIAKSVGKVIFIDTEGGFSVERLKQITPDYEKILENMVFFRPVNFEEQKEVFEKLKALANDKIKLIVVDTISMLYRIELGRGNDVFRFNKELGLQLSFLSEICRKNNIPVILTSQVYSNIDKEGKVSMVGGDIMNYSSKCLIELQNFKASKRAAILRKHRSIVGEKEILFNIVDKGFEKEK
ncbi:DNA repair and recombination protein RadB [Candidatus Woesearchaeota archaeon]|nr:DNA repair and recombination protein RadB [Candidatus Woesearchaeota archaeon]